MAAKGLENAQLVAHSMGGAVAASVALRDNRLVKALTLINSAGLGDEINSEYIDGFVAAADSRRNLKPVVQLLFANADLVTRAMLDDLLKYKRLDGVQDALRGLAASMFRQGRQTTVLAERLAKLSIPIQLVWGAKDVIVPVAHAKALPNARVEIVAEAGHMTQMEAASWSTN